MTSKAHINTLTTIAFVGGITPMVRSVYKEKHTNRKVLSMVEQVESKMERALECWKGIDTAGLNTVAGHIDKLKQAMFSEPQEFYVYTSFVIAMLEQLRSNLKDKKRLLAIDSLIDAISALHVHFDRRLEHINAYRYADKALKKWNEIVEA